MRKIESSISASTNVADDERTNVLTYAPTYVLSMRDAHRKPYQSIRAPALTRHLVFRKTLQDVEHEAGWVTRIESIILTCLKQLHKCGSGPVRVGNFRSSPITCTPDTSVQLLRNSYARLKAGPDTSTEVQKATADWMAQTPLRGGARYETVNVEAAWRNLGLVLRFELFEEYFTCTTTLELRLDQKFAQEHKIDTTALMGTPEAAALDNMVKEWKRLFTTAVRDGVMGVKDVDAAQRLAINQATVTLTDTVWREFDGAVLGPAFDSRTRVVVFEYASPMPQDGVSQTERRAEPPDEIAAHFTGVVLGLDPVLGCDGEIRGAGMDTEFERNMSRAKRAMRNPCAFNSPGAENWAGALFPFLIEASEVAQRIPLGNSARSPFETSEYTWSTFDGGRCLYGSGFGPQSDFGAPLQYVMLFDHDDHRSIGRAVHRLHTLGTLRLAALFDADRSIRHAEVLSSLDAELILIETTVGKYAVGQRQWRDWDALARALRLLCTVLGEERQVVIAGLEGTFHTVNESRHYERALLDFLVHRGHDLRRALGDLQIHLTNAELVASRQKVLSTNGEGHLRAELNFGRNAVPSLQDCLARAADSALEQRRLTYGVDEIDNPPPILSADKHASDRFDISDAFPVVSSVLPYVLPVLKSLHAFALEHSKMPVRTHGLTSDDILRWARIKTHAQTTIRLYGRLNKARNAVAYRGVLLDDIDAALKSIHRSPRQGEPRRSVMTKYYLERWKTIAIAADIGKVAGYQSYKEFVEHRLERVYDQIVQVGDQFADLRSRADALLNAKHREAVRLRIRSIEKFQKVGEYMLVGILVPYYLGNLVTHVGGGHGFSEWLAFSSSWLLGVSYTVAKYRHEKRKRSTTPPEKLKKFTVW